MRVGPMRRSSLVSEDTGKPYQRVTPVCAPRRTRRAIGQVGVESDLLLAGPAKHQFRRTLPLSDFTTASPPWTMLDRMHVASRSLCQVPTPEAVVGPVFGDTHPGEVHPRTGAEKFVKPSGPAAAGRHGVEYRL